MVFILELLIFVVSFEADYETESFETITSSPATLTFTKGLALMMVEWQEAIINISIPDVLSSPKILSQKDGYSLFTFSNASTVVITFKSPIKYFVIACPQENSDSGAVQFISNMKSNSVNESGNPFDFYFSVYGEYSLNGKIGIKPSGGALQYQIGEKVSTTRDLDSISLSSLRFTSKLIRSASYSVVNFSQLSIIVDQAIDPTIPMFRFLQWTSVEGENNNYLSNTAYGSLNDNIESQINDITPVEIKYEIKITDYLDSDATLGGKVDGEEDLVNLSGIPSLSRDHSFKIQFYVKYNSCDDFVKIPEKYIDVDSFLIAKQVAITNDDIPNECKAEKIEKYKVCFNTEKVPSEYKIGYKINGTNTIEELTSDLFDSEAAFSVNLYIIEGPNCSKNTLIDSYTASKDFRCIELTEAIIKNKCSPPQTMHYINVINGLSTNNKLYYLSSNNQYVEIIDKYATSSTTSFEVNIYMTNSICTTHTLVKKITSTTDESNSETITDSNIPNSCKQSSSSDYYICGDFSKLSNDFEFKYTLSFEDGTPLHDLSHDNLRISFNHPFTLSYYLVKSPYCKENEINGTIQASQNFKCISMDDNDMPEKCRTGIVPIPKPTDIPKPDEKEKVTSTINEYNNETLINEFNELNKENSEAIKIVKIESDKFKFNSDLSEDEKIKVTNAEITYEGGNLNLALDEGDQVTVVLNDKNEINLSISGKGNVDLQLSEANQNKDDILITLNKKSEIDSSVVIKVPDGVNSMTIDSIDFNSNGELKVLNHQQTEIPVTVKTVNIIEHAIPSLKNLIIEKSLTIPQSAKVDVDNLEFKDNSIIKYQFYNFDWKQPIISGNFNHVGKIQLTKSNAFSENPQSGNEYKLITGSFNGISCDEWGKSLDYGDSGLNGYSCLNVESSNLLETEDKSLVVKFTVPEKPPKKGNNNVGLIVGVVVGVVAVIAIVVVVVIVVIKKKKKNNSANEDDNANVADGI